MRRRAGGTASIALALMACNPAARHERVQLFVPAAVACAPQPLTSIEFRALGDFPLRERDVEVFDSAAALASIDHFPPETRVLTIWATDSMGWEGGGLISVAPEAASHSVLLSPFERSCPHPDTELARLPTGGLALAMPDGALWIAGGYDGAGAALQQTVVLAPADRFATEAAEGMLALRRGDASATILADDAGWLVVGGAAAVDGDALGTYEVHGPGGEVATGVLFDARREHSALLLGDGRVLMAGGRSTAGGAPLASAALFDPARTDRSRPLPSLDSEMRHARVRPVLVQLDDGQVLVLGGADDGAVDPPPERFDPETGSFESLDSMTFDSGGAAYVALPGARVMRIGGERAGAWTSDVSILLFGEAPAAIALDAGLPALQRPAAIALPSGEVLIVGRDPMRDSNPFAFVLGTSGALARELPGTTRPAERLVALADASIVELTNEGVSLRRMVRDVGGERQELLTPFDDVGGDLVPRLDRARLALDAPDRWSPELAALVDGARFDVGGFRFAGLSLGVQSEGAIELLLVPDGASPVAIAIDAQAVALGECALGPGLEGVSIERHGDRVRLERGGLAIDCTASLPERIGVAVRAQTGASVSLLSLARL